MKPAGLRGETDRLVPGQLLTFAKDDDEVILWKSDRMNDRRKIASVRVSDVCVLIFDPGLTYAYILCREFAGWCAAYLLKPVNDTTST